MLLMQQPNLLLHVLTLQPLASRRHRHARQRSLARHPAHAIISPNLRPLPPRRLLLINSLPGPIENI